MCEVCAKCHAFEHLYTTQQELTGQTTTSTKTTGLFHFQYTGGLTLNATRRLWKVVNIHLPQHPMMDVKQRCYWFSTAEKPCSRTEIVQTFQCPYRKHI